MLAPELPADEELKKHSHELTRNNIVKMVHIRSCIIDVPHLRSSIISSQRSAPYISGPLLCF